jgi:hypothetical protein
VSVVASKASLCLDRQTQSHTGNILLSARLQPGLALESRYEFSRILLRYSGQTRICNIHVVTGGTPMYGLRLAYEEAAAIGRARSDVMTTVGYASTATLEGPICVGVPVFVEEGVRRNRPLQTSR